MTQRVLVSTQAVRAKRRTHFDYPVKSAGSSDHFSVYYDPSTGASGRAAAEQVLALGEADYAKLFEWFGLADTDAPQHFNVIIAPLSATSDGSGGAYHASCLSADLYCDVDTGNPQVSAALMAAEAVEVFSATQAKGWDCGASNGEGLSRVFAELLHPGLLDGYASAPMWIEAGRPDWVTKTESTDQDGVSTGCAVLFLFYLQHLGFTPVQIAQAASPTLAGTYHLLTGKASALADFTTAVDALNTPIASDNPWSTIGNAPDGSHPPAPEPSKPTHGSHPKHGHAKRDA